MNEEPTEIADVLEEAAELLNRYRGAVPSTWGHNLRALGVMAVLDKIWHEAGTTGELMELMDRFLTAAFLMGVASHE